jgi:O-succinylbenzoic acid--CoA ligase
MYKDITFLENVKAATRQKVLNFVKTWNSKDKWLEVSTSGSTGRPKLIKLSKKQMRASAKATADFFNFNSEQTILLCLSADYIAGKMMVIRALENNMHIVVAPLNSNPLLSQIEHTIDFSAFVPMQVETILDDPKSCAQYEKISNTIIGGAPINSHLENKLLDLTNNNYATFGMTETISHIALRNINKKESHYTAMSNVTLSIDLENCLQIEAPNVCDDLLKTTDSVKLINNQQFIWIGRADYVINSGGIKLHPEQIEKKLESIIPNNRFYIHAAKDQKLGQKVILNIEGNVDKNDIMHIISTVLSKYEMPKEIVIHKSFKETKTGKVIRQ